MKINKYSPELRYLKYLHQNKHQKFGWGHWRWDPYNYDQGHTKEVQNINGLWRKDDNNDGNYGWIVVLYVCFVYLFIIIIVTIIFLEFRD